MVEVNQTSILRMFVLFDPYKTLVEDKTVSTCPGVLFQVPSPTTGILCPVERTVCSMSRLTRGREGDREGRRESGSAV